MKTKIIVLGLTLALIPAVANARGTSHHSYNLSSVGRYTYHYHKPSRIYCPYQGCKKSFSSFTSTSGGN